MRSDYADIPPRQLAEALHLCPLTLQMRKLLRAHLDSTGRVMTMSNLAHAAGYSSFQPANAQYGLLGKRIAEALDLPIPETRLSVLCDFIAPRKQSNKEWLIIMRPNFARALELSQLLDDLAP